MSIDLSSYDGSISTAVEAYPPDLKIHMDGPTSGRNRPSPRHLRMASIDAPPLPRHDDKFHMRRRSGFHATTIRRSARFPVDWQANGLHSVARPVGSGRAEILRSSRASNAGARKTELHRLNRWSGEYCFAPCASHGRIEPNRPRDNPAGCARRG